jgi:trimethylamine--corrinoid protein Co-methyltransferase
MVGDAEVVSAMVLIQLTYPGAPVFHSIVPSLMDPRTGGYIGGTDIPFSILIVQMAHAWNVPCLGGGSLAGDAQEIGWESGSDGGMGAFQIPLAGGEISGDLGMLGSSMILYPEQVILDHELCLSVHRSFNEFIFNEVDMALDVIKHVGPRGHYLLEKHTREHIRDFRYSPLFRQQDDQGSFRSPREMAVEEFKRIHATHQPQPLPKSVQKELDRILETADREAERSGV